ncbi:N-acetyltransferase [Streptomyces sp. NBC_01465]|uniref:N-acetyltransferase n=1 Tax=Streptomyces sp. NBC_01465 TaxID=2903878 RepID=UPI002E381057|nr:N-acetyltransferase [Streptomyces sp. NBC_01465]
MADSFVPDDFVVPLALDADGFRLVPLGPEHNDRDLAAWTSSIAHIRATPGFTRRWPPADGMSTEQNLADVVQHAEDFAARRGFTFTVLDGDDVIGCVYIYPDWDDPSVTTVRSWARADRAALDQPLHHAVRTWLATDWPFRNVVFDAR